MAELGTVQLHFIVGGGGVDKLIIDYGIVKMIKGGGSHYAIISVKNKIIITQMNFRSFDADKGWRFEFNLIFSPDGLVNERVFITKHIGMFKK